MNPNKIISSVIGYLLVSAPMFQDHSKMMDQEVDDLEVGVEVEGYICNSSIGLFEV